MKRWLVSLAGAALFVAASTAPASEVVAAKALFYNPNTQVASGVYEGAVQINPDSGERSAMGAGVSGPSPTGSGQNQDVAYSGEISGFYDRLSNPGINYWIELARPGTSNTKRVSDRHIFKTGDKIRIHVAGNSQGNLYVLHKGSSGREKNLQVSSAGNAVGMGEDYVIPSNGGWLLFDNNKGVEELKFVFAPRKPSSNPARQSRPDSGMLLAMYDQYSASKGLMHEVNQGTKDLVQVGGATQPAYDVPINRDTQGFIPASNQQGSSPGNYAVNTHGEPVAVTVHLRHQ